MLKKITCGFLLLALLLSLSVGAFAAETTLTIDAPETLPAVGQTFTVTVSIAGNPGLCAAQFTLSFDTGVVECQSVKVGKVLSGMLSATNPNGKAGAIIACAGTSAKTGDGILGEYTFRVKAAGDAQFALLNGVFTDASGNTVQTNVAKPQPKKTDPTEDEDTPTEDTPAEETPAEETPTEKDVSDEEKQDTEPTEETVVSFTDVPASYWGYEKITKAVELKLFQGYPDGSFGPDHPMTRAEFITVLYRISGDTEKAADAGFGDVPANSWYRDAVNWAAAKGYAGGDGVNFNPNAPITRQEVTTILFRYSGGASGLEALLEAFGVDNLAAYQDKDQIASWALDAMRWAVFKGILGGTSDTTMSPTGTATRAQVATIFVRYLEK